MKKILLVGLIAVAVTGCATTEQNIAQVKNQCSQIGYVPGSIKHTECTAKRLNQLEDRRTAYWQAWVSGNAQTNQFIDSKPPQSMTCHGNGYSGYGERQTCHFGNGQTISCYNNGVTITCN